MCYETDIRRLLGSKLALVIANDKTFVNDRLIYVATDMRAGLSMEGF